MFARLHIQPDVFMLTTAAVETLVNEAIQLNIGEVALKLGGVAQLNPDRTISVIGPSPHPWKLSRRSRRRSRVRRCFTERWPTKVGKSLSAV